MTDLQPSPSTQRFRSHPIHASLNAWIKKIPRERPENFRKLPAEDRDAYVRLLYVLRTLRSRLAKLNPMLTPPEHLNNINKRISQIQGFWDQYRQSPMQGKENLDNITNAIIDHMKNLLPGDEPVAWRDALEELRIEMETAIREALTATAKLQEAASATGEEFAKTKEKLRQIDSEIQAQKTRLDQMLTQQSETFTNTEQDRVKQFTLAEQDRLTKFNEAEHQRQNRFDTQIAEFTKAKDETIESRKKELDSVIDEGKEKSAKTLADITAQLDKAVEVVGIIVKTTMSGNCPGSPGNGQPPVFLS